MSRSSQSFEIRGEVFVCSREMVSAGRKKQDRPLVEGYSLWCSVCGDLIPENFEPARTPHEGQPVEDFAEGARQAAKHLSEVHKISTVGWEEYRA